MSGCAEPRAAADPATVTPHQIAGFARFCRFPAYVGQFLPVDRTG